MKKNITPPPNHRKTTQTHTLQISLPPTNPILTTKIQPPSSIHPPPDPWTKTRKTPILDEYHLLKYN
jgi:hypothetical protein